VDRCNRILRSYISIERSDRADRTGLVSANVRLASQIVTLISRDAVDERDRVGVLNCIRDRERPDGAAEEPEGENLGALGFFLSYRNELRKLHRWRKCPDITAEACKSHRDGQLLAAVCVYSIWRGPTRIVNECADDPARQNVRLLV